jgi:hypothetical protein
MFNAFLLLSAINLLSLPIISGFTINTNDVPSTRYICTQYSTYDTIDYYKPQLTKFDFPKTWNKVSSKGYCTFECSPCEKIKINDELINFGYSASCKITPNLVKKYKLFGIPDHFYHPIAYQNYNLSYFLTNNLINQEGIYVDYPNHQYISKYEFCVFKDKPDTIKIITENSNFHPSIRPTTKPADDSDSKPTTRPTSKPADDSDSKPTTRPTSKPADDSDSKPTTRPTSKPADDSKPTTRPTSKPADDSKPTTRPTSKPADDSDSKPTVEPASKQNFSNFEYKYCMKSPDHLPGIAWPNSIRMEFSSDYQNNDLTILEECSKLCEKYVYFGIDSGAVCKCGNTEPIKPNINTEGNCSPCFDDPSKTCGNVNYGFMSLYQIVKN